MRNLSSEEATILVNLLVDYAKHRKTSPFTNELVNFLKSNHSNVGAGEYSFLSEDYYPSKLVSNFEGKPLVLFVESENKTIIQRTEKANQVLIEAFKTKSV